MDTLLCFRSWSNTLRYSIIPSLYMLIIFCPISSPGNFHLPELIFWSFPSQLWILTQTPARRLSIASRGSAGLIRSVLLWTAVVPAAFSLVCNFPEGNWPRSKLNLLNRHQEKNAQIIPFISKFIPSLTEIQPTKDITWSLTYTIQFFKK